MEERNEAFQILKPVCVQLSQAALALNGSRSDTSGLIDRLEDLKKTLASIACKRSALDAKLADYVFFPISNVLKLSQKLPIRCLELSLDCIAILVSQGWRQNIQPQLATQIVILCTLMAAKTPKGFKFGEASDELQSAAFLSLGYVFFATRSSVELRKVFLTEANFPQLGQTISTILDGIHDGGSVGVQTKATEALEALVDNLADRELCASFLPGIVSKLVRILKLTTNQRRNHQILTGCLGVFTSLLRITLSDDDVESSPVRSFETQGQTFGSNSIITTEWKEHTATQLKPALTVIFQLRSHVRHDVRDALASLCLTLLDHCRKTLAACSQVALETIVALSHDEAHSTIGGELEGLIRRVPQLSGLLQSILYDWLWSLPTTMQSADEQAKTQKMLQISTCYELLKTCDAETGSIDRMLASVLRDSVVITLQVPSKHKPVTSMLAPISAPHSEVFDGETNFTEFKSPLVKYKGQEEILNMIEHSVKIISNSSTSPAFASDLARALRVSQGDAQVANFWLLLTSLQTSLGRQDTVDSFLELEQENSSAAQDHLEELYAFSLSILTDSSDDPPDSRLQSLALRTLALRAQLAGNDFRFELIDALYPVLHALATPDKQLQDDSITTLNILTKSCGYTSTKALIMDNVDYLTNAVALKLNAFDVSPQAPQVLLMMVRLAGPSLLPYLEDTVESIFAALEDYHGYPLLVELLFKVLGVMAEEGVRAPQLVILAGEREKLNEMKNERWQPITVEALAQMLRDRAQEETLVVEREQHPRRPWKGIEETGGDIDDANENQEQETFDHQDQQLEDADPSPPMPKTYNILFKITELTQHFLPSASPSLRSALLTLIRTTVPAIARHEDSFLPLINTLWPEVTARLDDPEPHVRALALEIVGVLCEFAGDFMKSRVIQLWPGVVEMYQSVTTEIAAINRPGTDNASLTKSRQSSMTLTLRGQRLTEIVTRMQNSPADYSNTSIRLLWDALVGMLTTVVKNMHLPPELFDEALEMLEPVLERKDVFRALEAENADALWLARLKTGKALGPKMPVVPDGARWQFAEVSRVM